MLVESPWVEIRRLSYFLSVAEGSLESLTWSLSHGEGEGCMVSLTCLMEMEMEIEIYR